LYFSSLLKIAFALFAQGAPALPKPLMKAITQALHDEDWLQTSIEGLLTSAMDAAKAPRNPRRPSLSHRPLQRSQAVHRFHSHVPSLLRDDVMY